MTNFNEIKTINDYRNLPFSEQETFLRVGDLSSPRKEAFSTYSVKDVDAMVVLAKNLSKEEVKAQFPDLTFILKNIQKGKFLISCDFDEDGYSLSTKEYYAERDRRVNLFISYLRNEYLVHDTDEIHQAIWSKAYNDGHSSGYLEVGNYYSDLADLVDKCIDFASLEL